jgi:outer membrane lipoprotein-sorting protein
MAPEEAMRVMAVRARKIRAVNSECSMTLTRPNGESVRLDGAVALSVPDKQVRLRAWKFNQAVFDLTLTRSGLWLEIPSDSIRRTQILPAGLSAAQLARALSMFGPDIYEEPRAQIRDDGRKTLEIAEQLDGGQTLTVRVDRTTLTARQYTISEGGRMKFSLVLSGYENRELEGIVWPTRMTATNDGSRIDVELRNVQINTPLPPAAFVPPRGAEKVP